MDRELETISLGVRDCEMQVACAGGTHGIREGCCSVKHAPVNLTKTVLAIVVFSTVAYVLDEFFEPSLESFVSFLLNRKASHHVTSGDAAILHAIKHRVNHELHFIGRATAACLILTTICSWTLVLFSRIRLMHRIKPQVDTR